MNLLKGVGGDKINVLLSGIGHTAACYYGGFDFFVSKFGCVCADCFLKKDAGNNCYRVAAEKEINSGINGKTLAFSKANAEYTTTVGDNSIAWKLDSNGTSISKIVYGGSISSSKISITVAGASLVVDSKKLPVQASQI